MATSSPIFGPHFDALADRLVVIGQQLGLSMLAVQQRRMIDFVELLARWNLVYNLTAVRDPLQMLTHHIADCLATLGPLAAHASTARRVLDVGSGGGLPGVVLAIMRTDLDVVCIDKVGKKAAFLSQTAGALQLQNLSATHARVEDWKGEPFDVVTARAFASLSVLTTSTMSLLQPTGCWMAMKGQVPGNELRELTSDIDVFHVEQLDVPGLDAERCLIWMRPAIERLGAMAATT